MGNTAQKECTCVPPVVIGISGPTRSGKSSLCNGILCKYPNCKYVCQDHFFDKTNMPIINDKYQKRNWETVHGINWDDFAKTIEKTISDATQKCSKCDPSSKNPTNSTPSFVLVEGFLLFQPQVLKYFHKKLYLVIDKEICYERRMTTKRVSEEYFQDYLWPCYVSQNIAVLDIQDMVFIDGAMPKDKQIELVLNYLDNLPDAIQPEEQLRVKQKLEQIFK